MPERHITDTPGPAATLERLGDIAVVTLNRPHALNAVDAALSEALGTALETIRHDPVVRVGVITGAGRAFCAGADLKELATGRSIDAAGHPEWGFAGMVRHFVDKPLIAAVNGFALGGGTEIVLACDLAVIDETAALGLPEVKRGLFAAAGGVIRLPRQIPLKVALEAVLTGEPINARRAESLGLVNRVAPAGRVLESALELARIVAANAPLAVRAAKRLVHHGAATGSDWEPAVWERNDAEMDTVFGSEDAAEGGRAFVEKRAASWRDR
ncbi:crotonase/enoyl-CoA hydratase family protein [Streptomyces iranensis]|uniref:enoyl-CoA hydratase n=1 Tax=Streptomyces iranensis TaxID=576784 RepID=A0A061A7Q2_9ACTN|nr:crotonase/enoyl-CoA hydratase family protein [Streptomyces iranensis]MBP2066170.1 crotonobetainyl-CoA hydratase [Streptomyces iranensis]CDR13134.1 enoyl-CoA hydratase [Streptomyces iranensis]